MLNPVLSSPRIEKHEGVWVVRDDILPGGTKARLFVAMMQARAESEFVYASPSVGLAQVALAVAAYQACRQATIFVAKRAKHSPRTIEAQNYGARIVEVSPGYLNVVQARAREYAAERGAHLIPFGGGFDHASAVTSAALALEIEPVEVWCAAGSGTLARALKRAWPQAKLNVVEVGKPTGLTDGFVHHTTRYAYHQQCKTNAPFPADYYYEAKAWEVMNGQRSQTRTDTLFWNVAGRV